MKNIKILLIGICLYLSGCNDKEPEVYLCVLNDIGLFCRSTKDESKSYSLDMVDAIGYSCVSPGDTSKIVKHHNFLHRKNNTR